MREPSDSPSFYDPEHGIPEPRFIDFNEFMEKLTPEEMVDAFYNLTETQFDDLVFSSMNGKAVEKETSDALKSIYKRWYESEKDTCDERVIINN